LAASCALASWIVGDGTPAVVNVIDMKATIQKFLIVIVF
jgi:hypothetical protein